MSGRRLRVITRIRRLERVRSHSPPDLDAIADGLKLGAGGIQKVYTPPLWDDEVAGIRKAAESTKELLGLFEAK